MSELAKVLEQNALAAQAQAPVRQALSLTDLINRAAADPALEVAKLEKLLEMYERITAREVEWEFNRAMAGAQAEMRPVAKDSDNSQTKSKYASYAALDRALRPIYTQHGFAISFDTGEGAPENYVKMICRVSHVSGHCRVYHLDMPADGKGAKGGDVMTKTHAVGSAMSYGARYLLKMIFNVAVGDADDDGNGAGGGNAIIDESQVQHIRDLIASTGSDIEKLCKYFNVEAITEIRAKDFPRVIEALNRKQKAVQK